MVSHATVGATVLAATRVRWVAAIGALAAATSALLGFGIAKRKREDSLQPDLFFRDLDGLEVAAVMRCACRFNLFSKLAALRRRGTPATAASAAAACNCSERGMRTLLECLCTYGHLVRRRVLAEGGRGRVTAYLLTPASARFLDDASPAYVGSAADWLSSDTYHDALWVDMMGSVHKGGAVRAGHSNGGGGGGGSGGPGERRWPLFAKAFGPFATAPARRLAAHVQPLLRRRPKPRILEVGAGHGAYGIEMAKACETAKVTAIDWPDVLAVTRANAASAGLTGKSGLNGAPAEPERWQGVGGDVLALEDLGGPYDVVLLPNVLHLWGRMDCQALLRRCRKALRPGGALYIVDRMGGPTIDAPFAMLMLVFTAAGRTYSRPEHEAMLRRAGFKRIGKVPLPRGCRDGALVAYNDRRGRLPGWGVSAVTTGELRRPVTAAAAAAAVRTGRLPVAGEGMTAAEAETVAAAVAQVEREDEEAVAQAEKPLQYPIKLGDFFDFLEDVMLGFRPVDW